MTFGLELHQALELWTWAGWLWPVMLVLIFLFILRSTLMHPIGFLFFGVLICFGIQAIVSKISLQLPLSAVDIDTFADAMGTGLLQHITRSNLISFMLAILPIWWLSMVFRGKH